MPNVQLSTTKTVFILSVVLGCFAILWPKVFYPMFQTSVTQPPPRSYNAEGCCDVIFDKDVNVIKIMTEMCEEILRKSSDFDPKLSLAFQQGKLNKYKIEKCRKEVQEKCNIDISLFLTDRARIGPNNKHILNEIRTFNSSLCLKTNFGVTPGLLGTPRHMRTFTLAPPKIQRQERLPHMRPEMMHPALRERGRAILQSAVPHSHVVPRVESENVSPLPRPGPIPGMRPPMGAAGHVVPPPKTGNTVGILMPMYTICIVVFFVYTMLRILFRKQESEDVKELAPDPEFRKVVFNEPKTAAPKANGKPQEPTKVVTSAKASLVEEVNREIKSEEIGRRHYETETKESQVQERVKTVSSLRPDEPSETKQVEEDIDKGAVKVVNIEMTESCSGGNRWSNSLIPRSRSPSPILSTSNTPVPEPIEIYLTGSVPSESKVLAAETGKDLQPSIDKSESSESGNESGDESAESDYTVDNIIKKVDETEIKTQDKVAPVEFPHSGTKMSESSQSEEQIKFKNETEESEDEDEDEDEGENEDKDETEDEDEDEVEVKVKVEAKVEAKDKDEDEYDEDDEEDEDEVEVKVEAKVKDEGEDDEDDDEDDEEDEDEVEVKVEEEVEAKVKDEDDEEDEDLNKNNEPEKKENKSRMNGEIKQSNVDVVKAEHCGTAESDESEESEESEESGDSEESQESESEESEDSKKEGTNKTNLAIQQNRRTRP